MADMKTNYVDVSFTQGNTVKSVKPRYQWDHGVIQRISGIVFDGPVQLHCAFEGQTSPAVVVTTTKENDVCLMKIPDELFQQPKAIRCYAYIENEEMGITFFEVRIPIIPRAKPSDYVYDPTEVIPNIAELLAEIEELREATEAAQNAAEYASNISSIKVSETQPAEEHVDVWIKCDEEEAFAMPEIEDSTVSDSDTWSSKKIQEEINKTVKIEQGTALAGKILYVDSEGNVNVLTVGTGLAIENGVQGLAGTILNTSRLNETVLM